MLNMSDKTLHNVRISPYELHCLEILVIYKGYFQRKNTLCFLQKKIRIGGRKNYSQYSLLKIKIYLCSSPQYQMVQKPCEISHKGHIKILTIQKRKEIMSQIHIGLSRFLLRFLTIHIFLWTSHCNAESVLLPGNVIFFPFDVLFIL